MSDEIKRGRSPSCPQISLAKAIELVKTLHTKAGKASISRTTAAGALGFQTMHGSALSTLAVLSQYGLTDAERGEGLRVSELAVRLIHSLSPKQESEARMEAALKPKVFSELFENGYNDCDEAVLANHLIQSGFTPEGARKAAAVYKANSEFANLGDVSMIQEQNVPAAPKMPRTFNEQIIDAIRAPAPETKKTPSENIRTHADPILVEKGNVLAQYSIPLGENEATLVFRGVKLTPEDFDDLGEYVELFKKQFIRAQAAVAAAKAVFGGAANDYPPQLDASISKEA